MRTSLMITTALFLGFGAMRSLTGCSGDNETIVVVLEAGTDGSANSSGGNRPDAGTGCGATEDIDTCGECCRDENPAASEKYADLVVACFCQEGDFCKEQCKDTLCAADPKVGTAGDPCDVCITQKNEVCGAAVNPGCIDDATCAPILQCLVNAGCPDKPQL